MEESFIRVLIVILIDVSSAQALVHDKCLNSVLCIDVRTARTMWEQWLWPPEDMTPCADKNDKVVKQSSQERGTQVYPPK